MSPICLNLKIRLAREPHCPICTAPLVDGCWSVAGEIAVCVACAAGTPKSVIDDTRRMWGILTEHGQTSMSAGLHFWTPRKWERPRYAAHLIGLMLDAAKHDPRAQCDVDETD